MSIFDNKNVKNWDFISEIRNNIEKISIYSLKIIDLRSNHMI